MTDATRDALTIARQMSCGRHPGSIIKHVSDLIPRCAFCGVSQSDWEAMETEMQWAARMPSGGLTLSAGPYLGNNPYPGNGNNSSSPLKYDYRVEVYMP